MKKPFIAFSIACACATGAFAGHGPNEQWQDPWFKGIGANATASSLDPTGGSWGTLPEGATIENKKLVLDLDDGAAATFTVSEAAGDTDTITEVKATAVFYPLLAGDLPDVLPTDAKVAFAVVKDGNALSYRARVAGEGNDWETLTGTPVADAETTVLIQLNYRDSEANFFINGASAGKLTIATDLGNPSAVAISGCGTVAAVDGAVQYGVASFNGKKYGTIADAIAASTILGAQDYTISVLRETSENVILPSGSGVKLADNGKCSGEIAVPAGTEIDVEPTAEEIAAKNPSKSGESGAYVIPVKVSGDGTINIVLPSELAAYKEEVTGSRKTVEGGVEIELQTKQEIVNAAITATGKKLDSDMTKLRAFLKSNVPNYESAAPDAETIGEALTKPGDNTLKLWQDYVLGIEPATPVTPVTIPTGDIDTANITLAIPAIDTDKYSGDYTVQYKVGETTCEGPSAIKVPLTETATYQMKIVLTPKN